MPQVSFSVRDLYSEDASRPSKLPKWILPLFIVAMTLSICSFFLKAYWISEPIGHRMISVLESQEDFHNVTWDDLCLIPRMHMVSYDKFLWDPRNSYNPDHKGWGISGILSPLIGGILIYLFGNYFIAMSIWGLINFSLMIILIFIIFRNRPFEFSQAASMVGTFLVLNLLWIGGQKFSGLNDALLNALLTGWHFSLVELECGLFTYLPYILFLVVYWKFIAAPNRKLAVFVGVLAGFLTYVYFYHQVFAFALISGHIILSIVLRRWRESAYLAVALGVGLLVAVPAVINNLVLAADTASTLYMQRLDYSPGRLPFQDYKWLLRFQIPFAIGIVYYIMRSPSELKRTMIRTWLALGIAYAVLLHLRIILGFMQSVDHFWRVSLGIPASLWCILAVFDLVRSRLGQFEKWKKVVYIIAALLPILILTRTTADVGYSMRNQDIRSQLTKPQRDTLEKLDCMEQLLKPGEGFLSVDPALNYHAMVNLQVLPFMAMGLSPISVDELSQRYLLSAHLTGRTKIQYPPFGDRKAPGYTYAKDLHLYLYVNLFRYPWSDSLKKRIGLVYQKWNPENIDWSAMSDALSTIKAVYVENEYFHTAIGRLQTLFRIEEIVSCQDGKVLKVNFIKGHYKK